MKPYLHTSDNTRRLLIYLELALCPFILYGFYKNGIIVFLEGKISLLELLKPFVFPVVGYGIALLIEAIYYRNFKKDPKWKELIFYSFLPYYALLVGMLIMPRTNIFLYLAVVAASFSLASFITHKTKWKWNQTALIFIVLSLSMFLLHQTSFANPYEATTVHNYSLIDLLFGRNIGGICTTSSLLAVLGYFFLSNNYYYKKEIPVYIGGSYFLLAIIYCIVKGSFTASIIPYLSYSSFFFAIFVATDSKSTPYTKRGKCFYGILCGVLAFLLTTFISKSLGFAIAILLCSLSSNFIDNLLMKLKKA